MKNKPYSYHLIFLFLATGCVHWHPDTKHSWSPDKAQESILDKSWGLSDSQSESVVSLAEHYLGVHYRFGGELPEDGFDCSGFVQYVFSLKGVRLPRMANEQYLQGSFVPKQALFPGDLVFFGTATLINHVGIYVGEDRFIHAPRSGRVISYDRLSNTYFNAHYQGARRIL